MSKKEAAPKKKQTLAELRQTMTLSSPRKIAAIPFRSDILNLVSGGILCGYINEISGNPGMFKSTLAAEGVIGCEQSGGYVVIHDKERKLTESRFAALTGGKHNIRKENPRVWYFEDDVAKGFIITIELVFEHLHQIIGGIRQEDLERLQAKFEDGTASASLIERYQSILSGKAAAKVTKSKKGKKKATKKDNESICKEIAAALMSPGQLHDDERSAVLCVADSVTSIPGQEEAIDPKTGLPNMSPQPALQARIWSNMLRTAGFFDHKVALLHIAQIRTHGIMSYGGRAYKKSAVSAAQEFYATNRIKIFQDSDGVLYRAPDGSVLKGSKLNFDERLHQIGTVINASVDKNLDGLRTDVPIYMLNTTGTDVVNSMWEFLAGRKLINPGGGWYKFDPQFLNVDASFRRDQFFDIYAQHGAAIWSALQRWKTGILYGTEGGSR